MKFCADFKNGLRTNLGPIVDRDTWRLYLDRFEKYFWFLHLLLQFYTDCDKIGCILFTIGWSNFPLFRFLNFYISGQNGTTWKYAYQKYHFLKMFFIIKWQPFCCEKKFKILNIQKIVHPIVKRMQKELSKSVKNCRRRWWIRKSLP